jgi:chaperone BCS1
MLTGPPGNGKTSFVTAVASKFDLNVAFLQPAEAGMTDSLMAKAMQRVPKNSVIVLEDVDALFDPNRKSATEGNALTFSGMLNALDGLTSPTGQIFFLTTNHQERLDSAMLRDGRVDVRCEFPYATKEQFQFMFLSFYKNEDALAEEFVAILSPLIGKISMSKLQSFFLKNRRNPAHAAISELPEWVAKLARDLEADAQMQEKARMEVEKREVAKKEAAAAARQAKDLADKTVKNPLSLSRSHE